MKDDRGTSFTESRMKKNYIFVPANELPNNVAKAYHLSKLEASPELEGGGTRCFGVGHMSRLSS